jgi:hypothetical protein
MAAIVRRRTAAATEKLCEDGYRPTTLRNLDIRMVSYYDRHYKAQYTSFSELMDAYFDDKLMCCAQRTEITYKKYAVTYASIMFDHEPVEAILSERIPLCKRYSRWILRNNVSFYENACMGRFYKISCKCTETGCSSPICYISSIRSDGTLLLTKIIV